MNVRLLFPTLYLKAADLKGNDATLTIARLSMEELRTQHGKKRKLVIYFDETRAKAEKTHNDEKRFVCNITNALLIADALRDEEVTHWPGKRITLFPTTCPMRGKIVDCIRVRDFAPDPTKPASDAPEHVKEPEDEADYEPEPNGGDHESATPANVGDDFFDKN